MDFSVDFSCRMRLLSSLLKRRRLTASYSFMKALALPRMVVKVRPLCCRGSANVVEEGVQDSNLIVLHVRAGSGLFSRSARKSSHVFWPDSSESLRVAAQAFRYSPRLSVTVRRRAIRFLIASRSSGMDQGLVYQPTLDIPTWSFAAARRTELKRWTLPPSDKGAVEDSSIASSAAAENEFQLTFLVFQRALRWDAKAAGTSHRMVVVMGKWSSPAEAVA